MRYILWVESLYGCLPLDDTHNKISFFVTPKSAKCI